MPYKDDIWDWSGTDVKVVNATVVLEGVSVITAEPSENTIEPLERADVELLLPIQIVSKEEEPTVSPLEIIDYGSSSIECSFYVTTEQAEEVVKGVLCGTTNPPTFENADYRLLYGQGSIDLAFVGLHQNTEYYLRPYALSNLGYKYGDVVNVKTKYIAPDEYQGVEYLYKMRTERKYIDTGIFATEIDEFYYEFKVSNTSGDCINLGCTTGTFFTAGKNFAEEIYGGSFRFTAAYGSTPIGNLNTNMWYSVKIDLRYGNGICELRRLADGVIIGSAQVGNARPFLKIFLFGVNINGQYSNMFDSYDYTLSRLYAKSNGNYLINYYPAYSKENGISGFYDTVSHSFNTDKLGGTFTVGPDKEWEE